jgi:hypothetical protein
MVLIFYIVAKIANPFILWIAKNYPYGGTTLPEARHYLAKCLIWWTHVPACAAIISG